MSDWRQWHIEDKFGRILRDTSVDIIKRVESGSFLDETIDQHFSQQTLSDPQKGLIYEIVSGVVRWKGYLDELLKGYVRKEMKQDLRYLLWVSLYQLIFMRKASYHVVNETVEYAKGRNGQYVAGFVNGVLRKFIRERDAMVVTPADLVGSSGDMEPGSFPVLNADALLKSFPSWLLRRWKKQFGQEKMLELLSLLNRTPEFALRVNLSKISREEAAATLEKLDIHTRNGNLLETVLYVDRLGPVLTSDLFRSGLLSVQDETSQLGGLTVAPKKGERILDACAGSGTKSLQLGELCAECLIVSMDREIKRLRLMPGRGSVLAGDGTISPFPNSTFDAVLVDAPCTSLGVIRKHPEIKWRRKENEIALFAQSQISLLRALWSTLKVGGRLVYSVCSFEPEETTGIIERFSKEAEFILENPFPFLFNKEYFLSLPHETGMDGFFVARLKKL